MYRLNGGDDEGRFSDGEADARGKERRETPHQTSGRLRGGPEEHACAEDDALTDAVKQNAHRELCDRIGE